MFDTDNYRRRKRRPRDQQQTCAMTSQDDSKSNKMCRTSDGNGSMEAGDPETTSSADCADDEWKQDVSDHVTAEPSGQPEPVSEEESAMDLQTAASDGCFNAVTSSVVTDDVEATSFCSARADFNDNGFSPESRPATRVPCRSRSHYDGNPNGLSHNAKQFTIAGLLGLNQEITES